MPEAVTLVIRGRVQGVGFRPFIYQLASENDLAGTVQNNMDGVHIEWEGQESVIRRLIPQIKLRQPRLARVDTIEERWHAPTGRRGFTILTSDAGGQATLVIPVDAATCPDCLREMRDRSNPRYHYPFINCTQCGPRYTIIEGLPYDRPRTSMQSFQMCASCAEEYGDPGNRRHHAQPIACPDCGPHCEFLDAEGGRMSECDQAIQDAATALANGAIIAIKGIGGFHLACDAGNGAAVARLRARKQRARKPLAVMARDLRAVSRIAKVSDAEAEVLRGPEAPIVLLQRKRGTDARVATQVAPGVRTIGVMLPYTPLHHLLFEEGSYDYLVMTSANPSGLPMIYQNDQAVKQLGGLSDRFLVHNREILHPVDDSVVQVSADCPFFLRRARGYVPDPVNIGITIDGIVALGSQMKNTFAIGRGQQAIIGPHLGDLDSEESIAHYMRTYAHLMRWTGIRPQVVARDMHPLYATRAFAETMAVPIIDVQHHHAHHVACMADNGLDHACFGIILDGTGYGPDGTIWGFEVLHGDAAGYQRLAHLRPSPLPGADRAVREPWRNAAAMLMDQLGGEGLTLAEQLFPDYAALLPVIRQMIDHKVNSPSAGTCGRLFDAVSALIGICSVSDYEGQAAIELTDSFEWTEDDETVRPYSFCVGADAHGLQIDFSAMLRQIAVDCLSNCARAQIARRFHETIVAALIEVVSQLRAQQPSLGSTIVLSGGSMSNPYLSRRLTTELRKVGFRVYGHHRFPNGDGGLSIGQLMIAAGQLADER
ncbi:MAG: carbamoyltransferase HypF [Sporolactobacillus sp.]